MAYQGTFEIKDIYSDGYIKISHHGVIMNNRSAALVGMDGTIDWACLPNFNSPPVFDSILDKEKGGFFSIAPTEKDGLQVAQYYREYTNVLITEFLRDGKVILRLTDFMPTSEYSTISFPEIHRMIETLGGDVNVSVSFRATLNYGGANGVAIEQRKNGFIFRSRKNNVGVVSEIPLKLEDHIVSGTALIPRRSSRWIVALQGILHLDRISDYKSYERLEETIDYWQKWSNQSNYKGMFNNDVTRSSLVLKGLFYEPTGLMVAAPTASLPECIGGERNWDYRYTWVRDTAYVIEALSMIGYKREATKFLYDMMDIIMREGKIRTIYPIDINGSLDEIEIGDYDGHRGSRPVRFGNKAVEQLQIDQYGSIVNAIQALSQSGGIVNSYLWNFVGETLDTLSDIWKEPDSSIWEFRTEPRHYVYSKLISWSAFRSAIQ
ncbi:MAG: glycoside hydrolase family 15 protein, partial [Thermoplasmataceae archaeon]